MTTSLKRSGDLSCGEVADVLEDIQTCLRKRRQIMLPKPSS
jgi:hypothetical protein